MEVTRTEDVEGMQYLSRLLRRARKAAFLDLGWGGGGDTIIIKTKCWTTMERPIPISVAPMMEWTDRHWRYMMRAITRRTLLYTEMVVDTTLLHQMHRLGVFLGHDNEEHPLAVQLGGNRPEELEVAAGLCEEFGGFCEINLNCGCPSPTVSKRCFGARLMLAPERVRMLVHGMCRRATTTPVTVKCRIGADDRDSYEELVEFVEAVRSGGARKLIVHARKCLLNGLSTTQNRSIPPLKYPVVHQLVRDFPDMSIVINGGITDFEQAQAHLWDELSEAAGWGQKAVHGVMVGRTAYNAPWTFRNADSTFFGATDPGLSRREVVERYVDYAEKLLNDYSDVKLESVPVFGVTHGILIKPLHNLFSGEKGGKIFRRRLSELWTQSSRTMDFAELVHTALEDAVPAHILDAMPFP